VGAANAGHRRSHRPGVPRHRRRAVPDRLHINALVYEFLLRHVAMVSDWAAGKVYVRNRGIAGPRVPAGCRFGCRQAKFAEDAGDVFLDRAEGKDEGGRDAGIAEFLQFLSSWLRRDTRRLGASMASFTGHPPTDMALTRAAAPSSRAGHDRETPYQRRAEEIFSASV